MFNSMLIKGCNNYNMNMRSIILGFLYLIHNHLMHIVASDGDIKGMVQVVQAINHLKDSMFTIQYICE